MSYLTEKEIICPACKFPTPGEIWSAINAKEDPELREVLMGGEINMVQCASCREIFYADQFLLYQDPDAELLAFVYPLANEIDKPTWEAKTREDFAALKAGMPEGETLSYEPLTLFGLDQLLAVLEADEESGIQGEIVSTLAAEHGFAVKRLRPSVARSYKSPLIIPYAEDRSLSPSESLVAGLRRLASINDRLFVYSEFEKKLAADPALAAQLL